MWRLVGKSEKSGSPEDAAIGLGQIVDIVYKTKDSVKIPSLRVLAYGLKKSKLHKRAFANRAIVFCVYHFDNVSARRKSINISLPVL